MSPELTPILVAVVTVGVALAVLMVGLFAWLRQDMGGRIERLESRTNDRIDQLESRTNDRIGQLESRTDQRFEQMEARINEKFDKVDGRFDRLESRLAAVEHGQAKLEGLLEGLREAIVGRRAAS